MHRMIVASILVFISAAWPMHAQTKDAHASHMSSLDRAIALAVYKEDLANNFQARNDLCVGFSTLLSVNQKGILADLKHRQLLVHPYKWCNKGPAGLTILVLAPVQEPAPGTFKITIEVSDNRPILDRGAHFATLLRRGTYTIKCEGGSEPELVQYKEAPRKGDCGGKDHC